MNQKHRDFIKRMLDKKNIEPIKDIGLIALPLEAIKNHEVYQSIFNREFDYTRYKKGDIIVIGGANSQSELINQKPIFVVIAEPNFIVPFESFHYLIDDQLKIIDHGLYTIHDYDILYCIGHIDKEYIKKYQDRFLMML